MIPHGDGLMKSPPFNPTKQMVNRMSMGIGFTKPKNKDFADIAFA